MERKLLIEKIMMGNDQWAGASDAGLWDPEHRAAV